MLFRCRLECTGIKTLDRDTTIIAVQRCQRFRQGTDRIDRRPAIHAGMQVAVGAVYHKLRRRHAAQDGGDGRRIAVPLAGITHQDEVAGDLFAALFQEARQAGAAGFLFAFEHDGNF